MKPSHPGEILKDEFMEPLNLSVRETAEGLGVSRKHLSAVINGQVGVSPELAVKIAKAFRSQSDFWVRLQARYDLYHAEQNVETEEVREFVEHT